METRDRSAVRALLLTPDQELLLMKIEFPRRGYAWITPGGGLEQDEAPTDGLCRELREETGLKATSIGPEVWRREHTFLFEDVQIRQSERYFLVPTPRFDPRTDGMPEGEVETIWFRGYRWWGLEELLQTDELLVPRALGTHLKNLVEEGIPSRPVEVGI
jgi:8-oxo-dGTP pyrophosphatase MutT (NUDIX family)